MADTQSFEDRRAPRGTRLSPHWIAAAISVVIAGAALAMNYGRNDQRSTDLEKRVSETEKAQNDLSSTVAAQATDIAMVRTEMHVEYQEITRRFDQLDTEIQNAGSLSPKRK